MGQLDSIDHVVVLMLENRSFDSILGTLYPKSENFEGLSKNEFNLDTDGVRVPVWNSSGMRHFPTSMIRTLALSVLMIRFVWTRSETTCCGRSYTHDLP